MPTPDKECAAALLEHRETVFRLCLGFARNYADAEDLAQDVFIRAFDRMPDLRRAESLRIWLLRIARTVCLDHHRRRRRFAAASADIAGRLSGSEGRPLEAEAEAGAELLRLRREIERLPRKHKDIFILREYGGLSYEEIARALHLRAGTVMSRLNRARRAVNAAMEGRGHE